MGIDRSADECARMRLGEAVYQFSLGRRGDAVASIVGGEYLFDDGLTPDQRIEFVASC